MRTAHMAVALIAGTLSSASAFAGPVEILSNTAHSTGHIGFFSGTMDYTPSTTTMGMFTISLTNTSPVADGGYITGVVFDVPGVDTDAIATLSDTNKSAFQYLVYPKASPFGSYEFGAALGGDWLGGGSPVGGIAVGETGFFAFKITASDAATLTAEAFVYGTQPSGILVRFKGFQPDGSDKVPTSVVPAPGSAVPLAIAGLLGARRRRR